MRLSNSRVDRDRVAAAFIGAAAGDALGWPQEANNQRIKAGKSSKPTGTFIGWTRRVGGRFMACEEFIAPGEYSDDTQLILATARSICSAGTGWFERFVQSELPAWLVYERGGGRATKAAAELWARSKQPWSTEADAKSRYYAAGGNGVAMRILPHAVAARPDGVSLASEVLKNGIATHGHPRALVGALVHAAALDASLKKSGTWELEDLIDQVNGQRDQWASAYHSAVMPDSWLVAAEAVPSYKGLWNEAVREVDESLSRIRIALRRGAITLDREVMTELGAFDRNRSGAGTVAAVAALYLASRYAADPLTGIRVAAYAQGADTDTLASMTGSLLGAMVGLDWLPNEWQEAQDFQYLQSIADELSHQEVLDRGIGPLFTSVESHWSETDSKRFRSDLANEHLTSAVLGPLGKMRVDGEEELRPIARSVSATRWRLTSERGQSVYVLRFLRRSDRSKAVPVEGGESSDIRRRESDLETLREGLPVGISATALLAAMVSLREALVARPRADRSSRVDAEEVTNLLARIVETHGLPPLSPPLLTAMARIVWDVIQVEKWRGIGRDLTSR